MPVIDQLLQVCKNRVVETSIGGKKTLHPWHNDYLLKFKDDLLEIYNNKINKLLLAQKVTKLKISSEKNGSFPWCLLGDGIKIHLLQDEKDRVSSLIVSVTPAKSVGQNTPGKRSFDTTFTPHRNVDRLVSSKTGDSSAGTNRKNNSTEVKSIKKTLMDVQSNDFSYSRPSPEPTIEARIASTQKLLTSFTNSNSPKSTNKSLSNGAYRLDTTVIKPEKSSSAGALQRMASTSSSSSHNSQRKGPSSKIVRNDSYNHNKANFFTPLSRQLSSTPGHVANEGFKNLGNTCFMNAVIQAFLSIEPFINAVASPLWSTLVTKIENRKDSLLTQMVDVIQQTKQKGHGPLDISSLKLAINQSDTFIISGQQEDAHEFLGFFLDKIQDEMLHCLKMWYKDYHKGNRTTPIDKVVLPVQVAALMPTYQYFHSEVTEWLTCSNCHVVKEPKEELFRHYEVALLPSRRTMHLEELLQHYFNSAEEREVLCDDCKCNRTFSSKQKITVLPNVLVINLKRFCADVTRQRFDKDCRSVVIPNYLSIEEFCASDSVVTEAPVVMSVEEHLSGVTPFDLMDNILVDDGEATDAVSPRGRKQSQSKEWKCLACTALNTHDSVVCAACESSKYVTNNTIFDDYGRNIGVSPSSRDAVTSPAAQTHCDPHYQYKLTAIVRHLGYSPYGGHYICDIAKVKDGKTVWKRCNDVKIETVTAEDVLRDSSEPYILFYARDESTFARHD